MNRQWYTHTLIWLLLASTAQPAFAQATSRTAVAARPKAPAPTPVAPQLLRARTAYLVDEGSGRRPFDDLSKALKSWHRWMLVDRASAADIVVSLAPLPVVSRARDDRRKSIPAEYQIRIQGRGADADFVWRDVDRKPTELVERLRTKIDGPPKICFAIWCK